MASVPISFGGGGGSGSDDCTGARAQARAGYTFIASDTDDEPLAGTIADYSGTTSFTPATSAQTAATAGKYTPSDITIGAIPSQHGDSGNALLTVSSPSKSYAAGWYGSAHGAQISAQAKSVAPATSAQTVTPDSGYVLSSVSVSAIPDQRSDSGNILLTAGSPVRSYPAGWYGSAHGAYLNSQAKSVTPSTSLQTITPDSGYVMHSVAVAAIPSQAYGGDVKLTASTTYSNFAASQWSLSRHYVYVDVYDGSVS